MHDLEHAIRERAYYIWIADGCRDGTADAHWLKAQREILAASLGTFARVMVGDTQASMRVKKKPARKAATKGKQRVA
jgi:hypothetical protein